MRQCCATLRALLTGRTGPGRGNSKPGAVLACWRSIHEFSHRISRFFEILVVHSKIKKDEAQFKCCPLPGSILTHSHTGTGNKQTIKVDCSRWCWAMHWDLPYGKCCIFPQQVQRYAEKSDCFVKHQPGMAGLS